jgi:hypothetical protein
MNKMGRTYRAEVYRAGVYGDRKYFVIRRYDNKAMAVVRDDRLANRIIKLFEKAEDHINAFCTLINFGLIKQLFDNTEALLQNVLPKVIMYKSLGFRTVVEVQVYKAMTQSECYNVHHEVSIHSVSISSTTVEVKAVEGDMYIILEHWIGDLSPKVTCWRNSRMVKLQ